MSTDFPDLHFDDKDAEAQITALILGELSPSESMELHKQIEGNLDLQKLHARLSQACQLLRETSTQSHDRISVHQQQTPGKTLKLSEERRNQLRAALKTSPGHPKPEITPIPIDSKPARNRTPLRARRFFTKTKWRDWSAIAAMTLALGAIGLLFRPSKNTSNNSHYALHQNEYSLGLREDSKPASASASSAASDGFTATWSQTNRVMNPSLSDLPAAGGFGGGNGREMDFAKSSAGRKENFGLLPALEEVRQNTSVASTDKQEDQVVREQLEEKLSRLDTVAPKVVWGESDKSAAPIQFGTQVTVLSKARSDLSRIVDSKTDSKSATPDRPVIALGKEPEKLDALSVKSEGFYARGFMASNPQEPVSAPWVYFRQTDWENINRFSGADAAKQRFLGYANGITHDTWNISNQVKLQAGLPLTKTPATSELSIAQQLAPVAQPEMETATNPISTFSLHVSDVSFRLTAESLKQNVVPSASQIRTEEFINAFPFPVPEPPAGSPIAFQWERAVSPYEQNREVLRLSLKVGSKGRRAGVPLNLVVLLDNSGSMERADRVRIRQECLNVLAARLGTNDRVSLIAFARNPRLALDGVRGDQAQALSKTAQSLVPEGGTNLEEALKLAYQIAARHQSSNSVNRVLLLTDGAANLGEISNATLRKTVEQQRVQGTALDCYGIGWDGLQDDFLEQLSRNGDGRYGYINTAEAASTDFATQIAGALQVAASDVKVQVEFNPRRVQVYRQMGYSRHLLTREQFIDNTVDAGELAAAESGTALYTIQLIPNGDGPIGTVRVRFKQPGNPTVQSLSWSIPNDSGTPKLEKASRGLQLAYTAAAWSEWLAGNSYSAHLSSSDFLKQIQGIEEHSVSDFRPGMLKSMITDAQRLTGK